ncbi:MAG: SDR family NAD(P)-dependent oxidoreductase [Sphingomonas sp.]|uniref:SDR family NAD(P)-dependent oxidoreductase n=1 Tax=Sphingomonas sp. TaxID=28214 RepID=UPI0035A881C3|nr:SDR family NAD(P)-dependent oxidoreductase [Sphingomonas sp.]
MNDSSNLRRSYGPWAVVTGASDGIGKAFAQELAAAGFDLVLVARRRAELDALALALSAEQGVSCVVVDLDLAQADAPERLIAAANGLDVGLLVAAAGYGTSGYFADNAVADESAMIAVNCRAVAELVHFYAGRFASRGRGGIIMLSSLLAFQGVPRSANYAATKAYIQTLAEGLRHELKSKGVDVLAVAPGPVDTGFAARARMTMSATVTPQTVAREALAALGHRGTIRPGLLSKLLEGALAPLPRVSRTGIMGQVMAGMTRRA